MLLPRAVALLAWLNTLTSGASLAGNAPLCNGVLVRFAADIPQDKRQQLVQLTQDVLKSTSQSLHKALGLSIGEVILEIPFSWILPVQYTLDVKLSTRTSDIHITSLTDSIFGQIPHAMQFGACGTPGRHITLPAKFLLGENPVPAVDKGKLLAREWMKYRYGVFDENGFPGDDRYPLYFKTHGENHVKITGCNDNEVTYKYRNENGMTCDLQVVPETNFPIAESSCYFDVVTEMNGNVTSSLMNLQPLENVNFFCGDLSHPHNAISPNKQNVLCKNRSIWGILKDHNDFKNKQVGLSGTLPGDPVFHIVKEKKNRVVVAIDAHINLDKYKTLIRNAVANLIYSLPGGSEFGVTTKKETSLEILPTSESNLNDYIGSLIITYREEVACPGCVVRTAIQMLSSGSEKSGVIVLISSKNVKAMDESVVNELSSSGLRLLGIQVTDDTSKSYIVEDSTLFDGTLFTIPGQISLVTMGQLYEAVEYAVLPKTYTREVKLYEKELGPNTPWTFTIDGTIENFRLWISGTSADQPEEIEQDDVVLVPEENFQPDIRPVPARKFFVLQVQSPTSSKWTCTLDHKLAWFVKITGSLKMGDEMQAKAWVYDTSISPVQMPWVIHASLYFGIHPVINATVEAQVMAPDGKTETVLLHDDGLGDPDITKRDGIYSRYFTQFTASGQHEIIVTFTDNDKQAKIVKPTANVPVSCCGSSTGIGEDYPTDSFHRKVKFQFTAVGQRPEQGYEPSNILDLQLMKKSESSYQLRFSAPGGEKDQGKAERYILKQALSYEDLRNGILVTKGFSVDGNLPSPKNYGETEDVLLQVNDLTLVNTTYYLSITARNGKGRETSFSNIVQIFLPAETLPTSTDPPSKDNETSTSLSSATIGYIVGIVLVILLVIAAYVIFYFWSKRKKNREARVETGESNNTNVIKKPDNTDDGSVTANEWHLDRDPISPVNSVPAAILVHHHAQVKDAKKKHRQPPLFKLEDLKNNDLQTIFKNIGGDLNTCFEEDELEEVEISIEDDVPSGNTSIEQPIKYTGRITKV